MKFIGFIMLTVLLQIALPVLSQTLTFSVKNVPLKEIFTVIKTQACVFFFYDPALLQDAKPVTIELRNVTLQIALDEIFKGQTLTWALEDRTVTIIKKPVNIDAPLVVGPQRPPPQRVKGSITDLEGIPIAGVSVMIKGAKRGTVSDNAGRFSIEADQKNILVFSSLNYSSKEVKVEKDAMNIQLQLDVKPMELLLVGGNMNAVKRKSIATSVTVIDSKTLEKIPTNSLDQIFRGWVPGTNSSNMGSGAEGYPSLTIRGAQGPGSLAPIAVYIDGIEYAGGAGYLSQLDKTNIDRIEIVRGPGAATLYGTGSNGGIIQIFTKRGRPDQTALNFTTSAGFYRSKWVEQDPFQQMHAIETTTSFKKVSIKLGGSYRMVGAYLPDGGENYKGFYTSAGLNNGKLQANFSARYNVLNYHQARSPVFDTATHPRTDIIINPTPAVSTPAYEWFNVRPRASINKDGIAETAVTAINLSHRTARNWVNKVDAGYTFNNSGDVLKNEGVASVQRQYIFDKSNVTTLRYSNVLTLGSGGDGIATTLTSGAEYKKYSSSKTYTRAAAANTATVKEPDNENYGVFVQAAPSYKNLYLTLGMRYENNTLFKPAWNPRIGITTNFDIRSFTIKPRISWGKGITAPTFEQRFGRPLTLNAIIYANPDLKAQSQQGFDYGLDVYDQKGRYKFEAVYYNNRLKDMVTQSALGFIGGDRLLNGYIYMNVGEVANTGWEFSGNYQTGRFSLRGSFSIMNTTITDTTGAYQIERLSGKPPGTRLIYLPSHTAGLELAYNFNKLFRKNDKGLVSINVTEVDGVRSGDNVSYALDVSYGRIPYTPGVSAYEVENSGVFRVGVYADYLIAPDLRFFVQGSNILNSYNYEFTKTNLTHGATWLFGLKYHFSESK